ncbi:diguanylate cyclase AdrA [Winslowiella iniecta]|uniref:diguanylate cyclase n=1 Tax=Winslowiella iniecta TaxID=1560201 RepID=A0A0L7T2H6_9GAMM|nr:diguanylate cyclase AdrA [Winslowiella iniecta]KOC89528.1 diguanylate cyclase [Winslowiella iniecta]KOC93918.1 diguanylate cyclase [Winslowiella iniecta]
MTLPVATLLKVDARRSGLRFARRVYLPRIVGMGFSFIFVVWSLADTPSNWLIGLLFINGFIWPHLAYWSAINTKDPMRSEQRNLLLDAVFGGVWIALMGLNALPSTLLAAMMGMNNIAANGTKFFFRGLMLQLAAIALTVLLLQPTINFATSPQQVYFCLPMLFFYPIFLGQVIYRTAIKLAQHKHKLIEISTHDGMTGVYNRRHWEHLLHNEYDNCQRYQHIATLLLIDLDHFKTINDTWGHDLGDQALLRVTEELRLRLRTSDIIGRFGGDEFAVIMPGTSSDKAIQAISRVRDNLHLPGKGQAPTITIHISVGVAEFSPKMNNYRDWLKAADVALYRAKNAGRSRTEVAKS